MKLSKRQKCYYAHFMGIYGTDQELRDMVLLESLGLEVLNPGAKYHQNKAKQIQAGDKRMEYFLKLVKGCDILAFRALPDGKISSGVAIEVKSALFWQMPVIELPSAVTKRELTYEQTMETLREWGKRTE